MLYAKYLKIEVHYEKSKDSIETRLVTMNKNIAELYIDKIREEKLIFLSYLVIFHLCKYMKEILYLHWLKKNGFAGNIVFRITF